MRHRHAALVVLGLIILVAGCLPTYVGNPDTAQVDPDLVGLWHRADNDADDLWAVHKMNERTYMIQSFRIEKSGDARVVRNSLACRGWMTEIAGRKFLSLEMFAPSSLMDETPDPNRYVVARVQTKDNTISVRGIDPGFVKGKPMDRPQQLEQIITDNIDNEALYADELKYEKVTAQNRDKLKAVIDVIR